ncbi:MAG: galactokinase [Pseudomonadota bacterium]
MSIALTDRASARFEEHFGDAPTCVARAPGRVNLIGEHTDYNDGFVLPAAIDFHTVVAAQPRSDRRIVALAIDAADSVAEFALDGELQHDGDVAWSNYLRGVVQALRNRGYQLRGANLAITGNVPMGAGLSSSAALEIAVCRALTEISGETISAVDAALIGQAAENDFVGTQCGIMDQLISACARRDHASLIDCRELSLTPVPLPPSLKIMIVESGVQRRLVDGEYNARRAQCEAAAAALQVAALRDADEDDLTRLSGLVDTTVYRRARHVITENARTKAMAAALAAEDSARIAALMAASHASMRDDFEITVPPIDTLVGLLKAVVGDQGGVRMTGGGFGGCVVALLPNAAIPAASAAIDEHYTSRTGCSARTFVCSAADGAFA